MNGAVGNGADEGNVGWLASINPIVKLAATLPWMGMVVCTRDFATPAMLTGLAALTMLCGTRFRARAVAFIAAIVVIVGAWVAFVFALLVRADLVAATARCSPAGRGCVAGRCGLVPPRA